VAMYEGLLSGIRVLDLGIWRPVPYATQLLSDLGADVLKVEPPGGDPMRVFPELFVSLNANKRSLVLDLHDDADRARGLELAADADVVIEGFRPGVVERLGMSYADVCKVNASIVYCSISGYGQNGPLATAPGHDLNYQAYAGVLAPRGGEPVECSAPIADLAAGAYAAMAICAALLGRARNGEGEYIDLAMTDVLATWTGPFSNTAIGGTGPRLRRLPTYGSFKTADDQWVSFGVIAEDHFWGAICDAFGIEDRLRNLDMVGRVQNDEEILGIITSAVASRKRSELVDLLGDSGALSPVLTREEMLAHPQFVQRNLVGIEAPDGVSLMGYPVGLTNHRSKPPGRAPSADEHQGEGFHPR